MAPEPAAPEPAASAPGSPSQEGPPQEAPAARPETWSGWIGRIASWIAPTTFVTALLLFFGYAYTDALYSFFGVDAATLGFATQDYLLRSSAALYLPVGAVLCGALLAALAYHFATSAVRDDPGASRAVRRFCRVIGLLAVPLLVLGFLAGFQTIDAGAMGTPLLLGGALLLAVLARVLAVRSAGAPYPLPGERAALGISVAIIALCSFWAAGGYAHEKGTSDAHRLAGNLALRPAVIVDTTERLYLQWQGVDERALPDPGPAQRFHYRYRGLRLLAQSNNRMFLIPYTWTWNEGNVLILPVDADVRVIFHPG
ncbi:hypothetical protein [Kitasatospora sp. NPDC087315]|uniref:hypothetical protein n=1 Tax=Kitasatospora sp. NPDC087315 TaxID=3364069 RepID=UPI0038287BDA